MVLSEVTTEHGEIASLDRVIESDERSAKQQHDLLCVRHHHLRLGRRATASSRRSVRHLGKRLSAKRKENNSRNQGQYATHALHHDGIAYAVSSNQKCSDASTQWCSPT